MENVPGRTKITRITIVTRRQIVIRRGRAIGWCEACGRRVAMLARGDAAAVCGIDALTIEAWVAIGRLHGIETAAGSPGVCLDSVLAVKELGGDSRQGE